MTTDPPSPSEPVESREQPRVPKFEPRPIRGEDVDGETWVRIWDLQKHAPFDEGKVIAYSDLPTVIIQRPDGAHEHWVASLPWERIEQPSTVRAQPREWPDPPYYAGDMARLLRDVADVPAFRAQGGDDYCKGLQRAAELVEEFGVQPTLSDDKPAGQNRRTEPRVTSLLESLGHSHARIVADLTRALSERDVTIRHLRGEVADLKSHLAQQGWTLRD